MCVRLSTVVAVYYMWKFKQKKEHIGSVYANRLYHSASQLHRVRAGAPENVKCACAQCQAPPPPSTASPSHPPISTVFRIRRRQSLVNVVCGSRRAKSVCTYIEYSGGQRGTRPHASTRAGEMQTHSHTHIHTRALSRARALEHVKRRYTRAESLANITQHNTAEGAASVYVRWILCAQAVLRLRSSITATAADRSTFVRST